MMISLCSCESYNENTLYAMNTFIYFKTEEKLPAGTSELINGYERKLSRTLPGSYIYMINQGGEIQTDEQTSELIKSSLELCRDTGGSFDISCGALTDLWNITSGDDLVPNEEQITAALEYVGYEKITVDKDLVNANGVRIDLGGVAKGYVAQRTVEFLKNNGINSGFVSFGGNVAVIGPKTNGEPWAVGMKDPKNTSTVVGNLMLREGYVSVSGGYERYFEKDGEIYHHIFDPKTGKPASSDIISVAVVCENGAVADGLSTAMFVMGKEKSKELYDSKKYDFETIIITEEKMYISYGLNDIFKPETKEYEVEYFGG